MKNKKTIKDNENILQKGIVFRIYPNKTQQNLITQTFGCCRLIYNKGLALREEAFAKGENIGYAQTSTMLTNLKKEEEFAFLKIPDSIALQQKLRDLNDGYTRFFDKTAAHPKFKSKHNNYQSYRTLNQDGTICIVGKYIKLPKLGYVKFKQSMEIGSNCCIKNATIERHPSGKYFVVLGIEFEPNTTLYKNNGGVVGIDVGIKEFFSDNNGNIIPNPKYLEKMTKKLIREQRRLSRKQKGSNNRNKQRVKVSLVHEKITNQRDDFLQKQSTILIRENQTICIEDLKIKNMVRNHKLARSISSVSWAKFFKMLEYKATWYGNTIIKVPTMYPSSQTCNCCGYKNPLVKNLALRKWECLECNTKHDRDTNASINILNKGLSMA